MIPKIIHFVWFGGEKPKEVLDCIDSWKKCCPDYEIREWNEQNCSFCNCDFLKEALALRKFAFASDVIRLAVLSRFGGIYLDTDVRLLRSFEAFLGNKSFIGLETPFRVSTAVIGSEPNVAWVSEFLGQTYSMKGKHFINKDGSLDLVPNTAKLSEFLNCTWHKHSRSISIYPEDFFCCKSFFTGEIKTTENSVAIHDFACTWKPTKEETIEFRLKNLWIRISISKP